MKRTGKYKVKVMTAFAAAAVPAFAQSSVTLYGIVDDSIGSLGTTGRIINATADIGDGFQSAPSSSRSRFAAGVGIIHRF